MANMIPESFVDALLDRADIVEVISDSITLKKVGNSFKACCPFHNEKTPSFIVSPNKQIFHCFGCGVGGDLIEFLIKYEKISFVEAVEVLAKRYGMVLPDFEKGSSNISSLSKSIFEINKTVMDFYRSVLKTSPVAKRANEYLAARGLDKKTVDVLCVGFALPGWDNVLKFLKQNKKFDQDVLLKSGLFVTGKEDSLYDRFRDRIMFPIFDTKDRVVGFGGRALVDGELKYINSPQTEVYSKGRSLYGLNFAKSAISKSKEVIIVEGYMDFAAVFKSGIENVVACLGTALTKDQLRLLKKYTPSVVMVYDADTAGELATLRNLDIAIEEGFNVKIVSLIKDEDPDSVINKHGVDVFKKLVASGSDLFDYKLRYLLANHSVSELKEKVVVANEMLSTIKKVPDPILQTEYVKRLSEKLSVDIQALMSKIRIKEDGSTNYRTDVSNDTFEEPLKQTSDLDERMLVGFMLESGPDTIKIMKSLRVEDFTHPYVGKIVEAAVSFSDQKMELSPAKFINHFRDDNMTNFISEVSVKMGEVIDREKTIKDCVKKLKLKGMKNKMDSLRLRMKDGVPKEELDNYVGEYSALVKKYEELKNSDY